MHAYLKPFFVAAVLALVATPALSQSSGINICSTGGTSGPLKKGTVALRIDLNAALPRVLVTPTVPSQFSVKDTFDYNYAATGSRDTPLVVINASFFTVSDPNYEAGTPVGPLYVGGVQHVSWSKTSKSFGTPDHINAGKKNVTAPGGLPDTLAFYIGSDKKIHADVVANSSWSTWTGQHTILNAVSGIMLGSSPATVANLKAANIGYDIRRQRTVVAINPNNDQIVYVLTVDERRSKGLTLPRVLAEAQSLPNTCGDGNVTSTKILNFDGGGSTSLFARDGEGVMTQAKQPGYRSVPAMLAFVGPNNSGTDGPVLFRNMGTSLHASHVWLNANSGTNTPTLTAETTGNGDPTVSNAWYVTCGLTPETAGSCALSSYLYSNVVPTELALAVANNNGTGTPIIRNRYFTPASPNATWALIWNADRTVNIQSLDTDTGITGQYLDGYTADGTIGLAPSTASPYSGTAWRAYLAVEWPRISGGWDPNKH